MLAQTFEQQLGYWPCVNSSGRVPNSKDSDQTPQNAASDLGLYCLLRDVCSNT